MCKKLQKSLILWSTIWTVMLLLPVNTYADYRTQTTEENTECSTPNDSVKIENELKYGMGCVVNAGKDTGYSEMNGITAKDPHFGWELGQFFISGYTRCITDSVENPIFLKTVGDDVALWFCLKQDIDALNGNENLIIYKDENGYDEYFGITKTNFGRGTLIVKYTNHENVTEEPIIYTDYLSAKEMGANTKVELLEEGDYEIALNYEIQSNPRKLFGQSILPTYTNYRIYFKFSVRNGNCMVYPFDVQTESELTNSSFTENGFYLDLAQSKYLDINIKKEVLNESANGLVEDVRFNRPAKDGDQYVDEGIYTITVYNRYTEQQTTKVIYVGKNSLLKAHVLTGLSIEEINERIALGAYITNEGMIVIPETEESTMEQVSSSEIEEENKNLSNTNGIRYIISGGVLGILGILFILFRLNRR